MSGTNGGRAGGREGGTLTGAVHPAVPPSRPSALDRIRTQQAPPYVRRRVHPGQLGHGAAALSLSVPAGPLVLPAAQRRTDPRTDPGQLPAAVRHPALPHHDPLFRRHRRPGHDRLALPGLSAGLPPCLQGPPAQEPAVHGGDHSALGELPGAGLCVEDHSGTGRGTERPASIAGHHRPAAHLPALQQVGGHAGPDPHLHPLHADADLRRAGGDSPGVEGSQPGPLRQPVADLPPRGAAALPSRRDRGLDLRVRTFHGRLHRAGAPGRQRQRTDGIEPGGEPLRRGLQLAARRGSLGGYAGPDAHPAVAGQPAGTGDELRGAGGQGGGGQKERLARQLPQGVA